MSQENQNLKQRLIKPLDQFLRLGFAITLLGNVTPCQGNWQVFKGKNFSIKKQEVKARFETKVGSAV